MGLLGYLRVQWDRSAAVACVVMGLISLGVGWIGVSNESFVAAQIPYLISAGFLGIVLTGLGAVLWLSADLRDDWRELRALREAQRSEPAPDLTAGDAAMDGTRAEHRAMPAAARGAS